MGGELQRSRLNEASGYSRKAHYIGMPSYLEPNSGSLHVPIEGVYSYRLEKIEDRVTIGEEYSQNHVENQRRIRLDGLEKECRNQKRAHRTIMLPLYIRGL